LIDDESVGYDITCKPTGSIRLELEKGSIDVTPENPRLGAC
jgi:hypothetical protein